MQVIFQVILFPLFIVVMFVYSLFSSLSGLKTLAIICLVISVYPLRLKIRSHAMRNLAKEFGLNFHSEESPGFFDFFTKLLLERKIRKINHIEGTVNNHKIHIYDMVHFFIMMPYRCIIEIDGQALNPRGSKFNIMDYIFYNLVANMFYPRGTRKISRQLKELT